MNDINYSKPREGISETVMSKDYPTFLLDYFYGLLVSGINGS